FVSIGTSGLLEPTQWYSRLWTSGFDTLIVAQYGFWQLLAVSSGVTLFLLGVVLFSLKVGSKQKAPFILAMVAGSLFYSLGAIGKGFLDPQWWNYRLVIGFVPILAVLASFGSKLPVMKRLFNFNRILVSIIPGLLIIL